MAPSPLATFSNQNPLIEYISLCSNSGGANQGMASLSTKEKKETKELEDPDSALKERVV